ncbi:MAG TPA: hypothetical protein VMV57_04500 [Terracidiphilus sp.]|nr:hypothetical protein [Terracidiphilus sp.]
MRLNRFAVPVLATMLSITGISAAWASGAQQGPPPPGFYGQHQDRDDWNAPPREFNQMQRQGFADGMDGARKDFENHRRPDVENRDEYRHPNVPRQMRDAYRDGFRRGYDVAARHLMGEGQMRMRQPDRPWDSPSDQFSDLQRSAFREGIQGARKDFENHRRPDVENRDEYRHPNLPGRERRAYREAFRRGYEVGVRHFYGDGNYGNGRRDDDRN